jgi:hypothetical protein
MKELKCRLIWLYLPAVISNVTSSPRPNTLKLISYIISGYIHHAHNIFNIRARGIQSAAKEPADNQWRKG